MRKTKSCGVIVVLVLSAIVGTGIVLADEEPIEIRIAPATLNLDEAGACDDPWVTVHAEIPLSTVNTGSLTLTGSTGNVPAIGYGADNHGDLVVKFDRTAVKEIVVVGEEVTLTLTGETTVGEEFTGSDTIRVFEL